MKSSVTSRKQRFWALLLAVVMVVGLLPTAGVKADDKTIKKQYWLDEEGDEVKNGITAGTVFKKGDIIEGDFESVGDSMTVTYLDVDGDQLYIDYVTYHYSDNVGVARAKIVTTITGDVDEYEEDYTIRGYEEVVDVESGWGKLSWEPGYYSDYWVVIDEGSDNNPRNLCLMAVPQYRINWNLNGGQVEEGVELPATYTQYDSVNNEIDLTKYIPTKENYIFDNWAVWAYSSNVEIYEDGHLSSNPSNVYRLYDMDHFGDKIDVETIEAIKHISYEDKDEDNEAYYSIYSIELEASWEPEMTINYYPYYNLYGNIDFEGKVSGEPYSQQIKTTEDLKGTLLPVGFTCEIPGFEFECWSGLQENGEYSDFYSYDDQADVAEVCWDAFERGATDDQQNLKYDLYAIWQPVDTEYIVVFDNNVEAIIPPEVVDTDIPTFENESISYNYIDEGDVFDSKIVFPNALESESGDPKHYRLKGWQLGTKLYHLDDTPSVQEVLDVAGIDWKDGIVKNNTNTGEAWKAPTITFTAQWEPIEIDILFDANAAEYSTTEYEIIPDPANLDDKKKKVPFDSPDSIVYPEIVDKNGKYGVSGWKVKNEKEGSRTISTDDNISDIVLKSDEVGATEYSYLFAVDDALVGDISNVPNNPTGGNIGEINIGQGKKVGKVTLYAIWKKLYTVTFDYCYPKDYTPNKDVKKESVFEGYKIVAPSPTPEYEGYTFAGWYYNPNVEGLDLRKEAQAVRPNTYYAANPMPNDPAEGDEGVDELEEFDFDYVVFSDVTLIAKWTPIDYTVKFDANGGSGDAMADQGFKFDQELELRENTYTKTGYSFGGWAETATGAKKYDDKQSVSNLTKVDGTTITLYAVWTPNTYTVAFNKNNENANGTGTMGNQSFTYDVAQALTANDFTNPGYTFVGWATTEKGNVVYADKAEVNNLTTENGDTVTLYAIWTVNENVTLRYDNNGGTGTAAGRGCPKGSIINLPPSISVFQKNGYHMVGFSENPDAAPGSDEVYSFGDEFVLEKNTTLYAVWEPNEYQVRFISNPNEDMVVKPDVGDNPATQGGVYSKDSTITIALLNDADYADYKFVGWSLKPGSEDATVFKANTNIKDLLDEAIGIDAEMAYSDEDVEYKDIIKLYGVWEKKQYTVTFELGDGHGELSEELATQNVYYQGKVTAPSPAPTDFGYELTGWGFSADEGIFDWDFDYDVVYDDTTLIAQWEPIDYTFKFEVGNQENGPKVDSRKDVVKSYIEAIYLPELSDEDKRFTFVGWAISDQATKAKYNADEMQDVCDIVDELEPEDNIITLYAVWTQKPTHNVIWQDENGNTIDTMKNVPEGEEDPDDFDGELPSKDDEQYNYEFDKWELVDDESDDIIYRPTFKTTTLKKYKVTFVDADGTTVLKDAAEYDYGTEAAKIVKPADPTKEGYEFTGWDPELVDVKTDATYKAVYNIKKYGVKFIDDDNRLISEIQYDYGTEAAKIVKPADPTKAGYTFTGWDKEIEDVKENATYKATYSQNASGGNDNPVIIPPVTTYYTITWNNYNGTQLGTTQVEAGKVPAYNGATPTRAGDADYTYTFKGWTPVIAAATGNATYTAEFTATKRETYNNPSPSPSPTPTATPTPTPTPTPAAPQVYDIEYYEELEDGTVVQLKKTMNPDTYTYGVGAVIKYGIDKEGYKFNGWYSKRSKKYVDKVSETTKGTVKLYARFLPIDDGNGNGGNESAGTPDSEFGILCVRLTDYTEDSMTLMWDLMEGVDGYDIFGSRCNSKDVIRPYEPIDSVDANTDHYVANDLLKQTYYKFYVRAYILVNNEKRYITTSINVHGVTLNEKYGVADDIIVNKVVVKGKKSKTKYDSERDGYVEEINITMKVGQTLKIVASEYNADGKEIRAHRPISFESSKPDILKVGKKKNHKYGVEVKDKANTYKSHTIFANAAGECTIYVFAQNGLYTKVNVTIKE